MLIILWHILKNQQNENENEHLRVSILRFSLFKGLGNVGYFVHRTPLTLSETDSPVCGWYHALSSKPPLHCGSRWSGRSWTPSSPPYLCSTIKSNWWLIISEHTSTEPCPRLPSVHLQDATPPDGPVLLWFTRFTRFDCASGQPSVLETLAPNWRQLSAYWRVVECR